MLRLPLYVHTHAHAHTCTHTHTHTHSHIRGRNTPISVHYLNWHSIYADMPPSLYEPIIYSTGSIILWDAAQPLLWALPCGPDCNSQGQCVCVYDLWSTCFNQHLFETRLDLIHSFRFVVRKHMAPWYCQYGADTQNDHTPYL